MKPLADEEIRLAKELCCKMGECSATYHICIQLSEIERLREELFLCKEELRQMTECRDDLNRLVDKMKTKL